MGINILGKFKIKKWYHLLATVSAIILSASFLFEFKGIPNKIVTFISLGFFFISLGIWEQNPKQAGIYGGYKVHYVKWCTSISGMILIIAGLFLIIVGLRLLYIS